MATRIPFNVARCTSRPSRVLSRAGGGRESFAFVEAKTPRSAPSSLAADLGVLASTRAKDSPPRRRTQLPGGAIMTERQRRERGNAWAWQRVFGWGTIGLVGAAAVGVGAQVARVPLTDVPQNHWARAAIQRSGQRNVMAAPAGRFEPGRPGRGPRRAGPLLPRPRALP